MTKQSRLAICGVLALFTFNAGWIAGDAAQRSAFSPIHHDISDLGALTASSPWLYNQIAANLSGLLVLALAVAVWLAPRPAGRNWVDVAGTAALAVTGLGMFLDGIFRLDCQAIDEGCVNDSWHAHAHKIESAITAAATFAALILLPFVLRRVGARWRPMLAAIPLVIVANIAFSALGNGAATRAGTVVVTAALAYVALQLLSTRGTDRAAGDRR